MAGVATSEKGQKIQFSNDFDSSVPKMSFGRFMQECALKLYIEKSMMYNGPYDELMRDCIEQSKEFAKLMSKVSNQ